MAFQALPDQMLACQVVEFNQPYKIHHIPRPRPDSLGPYDILLKTAVASFCHTDQLAASGFIPVPLPFTASHEGTGTVVAIGAMVRPEAFAPGDRVQCGLMREPCGICEACQGPENYSQYCNANAGAVGLGRDGAFAEYVVCDSRTSVKLPDKVSFQVAAPLACAGLTVWRGILLSDVKDGQWLGIIGSGGGLGHLGIQFAKALGLKVIGVDARDEGLALSKECGADVVIDARNGEEQITHEVHQATGAGKGVSATLNVSDAPRAAATACAITKKHGQVIQLAQPQTVDIPFNELIFRDIRVRGSLVGSPGEAKSMLDLVAKHDIKVKENVHHGLEEIPRLVDLARNGKMQGKGIVIVDESQLRD